MHPTLASNWLDAATVHTVATATSTPATAHAGVGNHEYLGPSPFRHTTLIVPIARAALGDTRDMSVHLKTALIRHFTSQDPNSTCSPKSVLEGFRWLIQTNTPSSVFYYYSRRYLEGFPLNYLVYNFVILSNYSDHTNYRPFLYIRKSFNSAVFNINHHVFTMNNA